MHDYHIGDRVLIKEVDYDDDTIKHNNNRGKIIDIRIDSGNKKPFCIISTDDKKVLSLYNEDLHLVRCINDKEVS